MSETPADLARHVTWREIHAQPAIWAAWAQALPVADLRAWVAAQAVDEVWFCGAGSSAYVAEIVVAGLEGQAGPRLRAIASTDIVARPQAHLRGRRPLVVSFGRSGNSAETIGVLDALDALAPAAPRLNITCNAAGALANRPAPQGALRAVVLPPATHDAGFAMTASFTTMLLTALGIFHPQGVTPLPAMAQALAALLPRYGAAARAALVAPRIVFVGAGPLAYAARECALKVMELTAGRVAALWDSSLGFRHGPKSFVRDGTHIVALTAAEDPAARYDADLVAELRRQFPRCPVTAIGPGGDIALPPVAPVYAAALAVPFAQVLAVVWSDRLGLAVDDPFAGQGTLSRVVTGVRLYPVQA